MIKKISFILALLLLLVSVGAVSAVDDLNDTIASDDGAVLEEDVDEILTSSQEDVVASATHTIDKNNYNNYFNYKTGELISTSVQSGDTIILDNDISGVNFVFKKPVNLVGSSTNALKDVTITFYGDASGSKISNLNIENSAKYAYGVFLNGASNCVISGCTIKNTGESSYPICVANNANSNDIVDNRLTTFGITYGHGTRSTPTVLLSGAHHNYIANNVIDCDDANGIYLSSYSGGPLNGGKSNFNVIYNNTIKYNVLPTSWAYGIQLMGENNKVEANKIIGAYLAISAGEKSEIINNWIINLTGADYNHVGEESGGQYGIAAAGGSVIKNNHIVNAKIISSGAGISVSDNSIVEGNDVEVLLSGVGIHPQGSNVTIKNNNIITKSGTVIWVNSYIFDLTFTGNNLTSQSGIGILIQKVSNKKVPGNITITYNVITTTNTYAIDAAEADKTLGWTYYGNVIVNKNLVNTPEGQIDSSKPTYDFNGPTSTIWNILPANYANYINDNGGLSSNIKDGDTLKFTGAFYNKGIIYINKAVKITGDAIFYNTTFRLSANCVWIENIKIRNIDADRLNAWGVLVYNVNGATIKNCDIEVKDPNAAYAIYVVEASSVDVINNTLSSSGNYLTYTLLAHTVEDCRFINNTIHTNGTGQVYKFENEHCLEGSTVCPDGNSVCTDGNTVCPDGNSVCTDGNAVCTDGNTVCTDGNTVCPDGNSVCTDGNSVCTDGNTVSGSHVLSEVYRTYGILMAYSSENIVSGNKVYVKSKLNQTYSQYNSTNSVVGIDLYYNSHNNVFSDNYVNVEANDNYIYGMGVLGYFTGHPAPEGQGATNNHFINNEIVLNGTYFVEGIVIGSSSESTLVKDNTVNIKSQSVAYGVNLETSQGSSIMGNSFTLNSQVNYGIEAYQSNNNAISQNNISAYGKQVCGMVFSNSSGNRILGNKIVANSTGEDISFNNFDTIDAGNAGIALMYISPSNVIDDNNITSTKGFAVVINDLALGNVVSNNYMVCEEGFANGAVNGSDVNNTIEDNYIYLFDGVLSDINIKYLEEGKFLFTTSNADLNGAVVKFYDFEDVELNSTVLANGKAEFTYLFSGDYLPGSYEIYAIVSKENYKVTQFRASLSIDYGDLNVSVDNVTGAVARNAKFTAVLKDILGNGASNILVEFYIIDEGFPVYIGKATSDKSGVAVLNAIIPKVYGDNPQIHTVIKEQSPFTSCDGYGNLTAYWLTDTRIILSNTKLYPDGDLAVLKDKNGNSLANKKVSIIVGSNSYSVQSDSNGIIKMPRVQRGSYHIYVSFEGDDEYYESSVSSNIAVMPSITENKDYTVYYGNTIKYKVRIKGSDGNYVGAGEIVLIKVNGKTYNVKTDKNGYATQAVQLKSGSYTITAEYKGDKVSNKLTFKPTLTAKNIVKKKAKKIKFSAKLVDKNGKALKNKKVSFKVKGKTYKAKTNRKGIATVTLKNLKVGKFTITSSYGGCSIKNTIKIKK